MVEPSFRPPFSFPKVLHIPVFHAFLNGSSVPLVNSSDLIYAATESGSVSLSRVFVAVVLNALESQHSLTSVCRRVEVIYSVL